MALKIYQSSSAWPDSEEPGPGPGRPSSEGGVVGAQPAAAILLSLPALLWPLGKWLPFSRLHPERRQASSSPPTSPKLDLVQRKDWARLKTQVNQERWLRFWNWILGALPCGSLAGEARAGHRVWVL